MKSWVKCGRDESYASHEFRLRPIEVGRLMTAFEAARLWQIYPQFWDVPKDYICIDGEELIFERARIDGYRFAEANAQCEAPAKVVEAARLFIHLAREPSALRLLD